MFICRLNLAHRFLFHRFPWYTYFKYMYLSPEKKKEAREKDIEHQDKQID